MDDGEESVFGNKKELDVKHKLLSFSVTHMATTIGLRHALTIRH